MLSNIRSVTRFAAACVAVLASIFLASGALAAPLTEAAKIDALIRAVEARGDLQFLRNDISYSAREAALHLRMKRAIAGSQIKTVDDFIDQLATGSSMTGKPYLVRFVDGKLVPSAEFLRGELKRISRASARASSDNDPAAHRASGR